MLQQDKADDYIIATNETRSIREFLDEAFKIIVLPDRYRLLKRFVLLPKL